MTTMVETTGGRLRGCAVGAVQAFLGIPYAMPPTPPHRFMAPRPPAPWAGVREASAFANQAPQLLFPFLDPALADNPAYDATRDFHRGVVTEADPLWRGLPGAECVDGFATGWPAVAGGDGVACMAVKALRPVPAVGGGGTGTSSPPTRTW